mgnify:CR=1 FL=1
MHIIYSKLIIHMRNKRKDKEEEEEGEIERNDESGDDEDGEKYFEKKEINNKNLKKTTNELLKDDGTLNKRKTRTLSEKQKETLRVGREKRLERIRDIQKERQNKIAEMVEKVAEKKIRNKKIQRDSKRIYDEDDRIISKLKKLIKEDEVDEEPIYINEENEKSLKKVSKSENLVEIKPKKKIIIDDADEDEEEEIIIRKRVNIEHPRKIKYRNDPLMRHRQ